MFLLLTPKTKQLEANSICLITYELYHNIYSYTYT